MPVNRINSQINLKKSDSVILVYGQVNDTFVTGDLKRYNVDGIEKILCRYLQENGYEQVIFYAPERQLYTYDERSYQHCLPKKTENTDNTTINRDKTPGMDGRPLGTRQYLRKQSPPSGPTSTVPASPDVTTENIRWNTREGFIPVVQGSDVGITEIIREALFQNDRKSAVIFSQFDNPGANSEIQRLLLPLISRLQRRTNVNKCIIITNAVDQEKLKEVLDSIPSLSKILSMENVGKGLDSLIYISYPHKDEILNLMHRERILKEKEVDWKNFERIVTALDQGRDELKRWERDFNELLRIDIPSINRELTDPISEDEQSGFKKLDALIGLSEVKKSLRNHIIHIREIRENDPENKPLMHIVLKGNPGTGKTTLARLVAEIFREEGLLERGHLIEVDREKLVAGFVGQTAIKTDRCCRDALGGVLFVDEAYALAPHQDSQVYSSGSSQDFGKEAIDTLIKRMTDWQDRFCVILAGYPEDMNRLLASNPGFSGRIGLTIHIEDYLPEELVQIFIQRMERMRRTMSNAFEKAIVNVFTSLYKKRGKKFDNARTVEQLFNKINTLYIERCIQKKLDRKVEPYQVEDIPSDLTMYIDNPPADGNAMERLIAMVGLEKAKKQIQKQIALVHGGKEIINYSRGRRLHMVFTGNPGTGKTAVARLVGEIYQHFEILSNNNFVEAGRKDLVGTHQGHTAQKVEEKCKEARGGILFIDEAYTLVNDENDTFGREAVDALMKIMEDERDQLCVIIAGYPDKISEFLNSNSGLRRRFSTKVEFEDYDAAQLFIIFQQLISKKGITILDNVAEQMRRILKAVYDRRDENFGNAGEVENIVQQIQENHALRCLEQKLSIKTTPVEEADIPKSILDLLPMDNSDETIEKALKELNELVGLSSVKKHIRELVNEYKHELIRLRRDPQSAGDKRGYHMIFKGNPGTGKTTVARIMGKIFKSLDILKKGEVIEVSRADFIAGYQGQTADKTRKLIRNAFDNVLFIDEAYSLFNDVMDSFGQETINILVKMMEDHRDRLVVIAAGYPREMRHFQRANSGLASRFREINFSDYDVKEMVAIFKSEVKKRKYHLSDELDEELEEQLNFYKAKKGSDFGNARDVKSFLDNIVMPRYRTRVEKLDTKDEAYWTIAHEDFPKLDELKQPVDGGQPVQIQTPEFSPTQKKLDQRNIVAGMHHSGSGDIVLNDKNITNNYILGNAEKELPKLLTDIPEINGAPIFGRSKIVSEMFQKLYEAGCPNKMLLYGLPGVGKTKTIIKFIEDYEHNFDHIIWLDVNVSLHKTFIENKLLLKNIGVDFTEKEDEATRFIRVISRLRNIKKRCLLVIEGVPKSSDKEFGQLLLPDFKIVASAREEITGGYAIKLEPLEPEAAKSLFYSFLPGKDNIDRLENLLEPVSYHPLAVEVLAKILKTNPNMQFDRLLELVGKGLHIRKGKIDLSYDMAGGANDEVIHIFSTLFRLAELGKEEMEFLSYFSVLPSHPIAREILYELFLLDTDAKKDRFNDAFISLTQKGFISEETGRGLFCHQIIQQVCRNEIKPTVENCHPLFLTLGTQLGNRIDTAIATSGLYTLVSDYLHILETFVIHFEESDLFFYRVYINLSLLYRINGQFDESIRISLKEKATLEPQKWDYPTWYNIINRNIAGAQANIGAYAEAEQYYAEGVNVLEQINLKEHDDRENIERELILTYSQLGTLQLRIEKHDLPKAIEYFRKGLDVANNSSHDDPLALASLRESWALAQIEQGDCGNAIENLEEAKKLLIKGENIEKSSVIIAGLDLLLAHAYAVKKDFGEARRFAGWALESIKKHLPEDNLEFYRAYNISAIIDMQDALHRMDLTGEADVDTFQKAGETLLKAIKILEDHRGQEDEDLAMMYSNYGVILKFSGNETEGYRQHMRGVGIYKKIALKNDLVAGIVIRTIFFFEDQVSTMEAEEYLVSSLKMIEDNSENLLDISFVNYCIGLFKHKNGSHRDGIDAINTALNGVRKYFGKNSNPENDSPLEVICIQEMAEIHSGIGDHSSAIKWQEEAVQLCEDHMEPADEELAEPYIQLAKIYLAAAKSMDNKKMYGDSLEYKTKAIQLNPKIIQVNKELEESGELYLVAIKNDEGVIKKKFVVIPSNYFSQFEADFRNGILRDLSNYGYVLPGKSNPDVFTSIESYTKKYGALNEQFASQG
jgi:SpoVK/Ycf46/Vps4 family AAA+-type ATPase/tetratricopeptide (TPR) repeat protein